MPKVSGYKLYERNERVVNKVLNKIVAIFI